MLYFNFSASRTQSIINIAVVLLVWIFFFSPSDFKRAEETAEIQGTISSNLYNNGNQLAG